MLSGLPANAVESPPYAEVKRTMLLPTEADGLPYLPPIRWLIFFSGNPQDAAVYIRGRYKAIVEANTWLLSRIVGSKKDGFYLEYPVGPIPEEAMDQVIVVDPPGLKLHPRMPYQNLADAFRKTKGCIGTGSEDLNSGKPVARVYIVSDDTNVSAFGVIVEMSHICSDGFTALAVTNMLFGKDISSLDPVRKHQQNAQIRRAFKKNFDTSKSCWFMCFQFLLPSMCTFSKAKVVARRLDMSKIAKARRHCTQCVTENDIIASNYANITNARVLFMAVNYRHYVEGGNWAGNYMEGLIVGKKHFETPEKLRQLFRSGNPFNCDADLPGFFQMPVSRMQICTNVGVGPTRASIPGCELIIFFPLMEITWGEVCLIYRDSKGTCVMYHTRDYDGKFFDEHAPVSDDPVSRDIFG